MPADKVRALLGEPLRSEDQGDVTCWYYGGGEPLHKDDKIGWIYPRASVLFSKKGAGELRVTNWREP